jgi:hypothetical protein
MGQHVVKLTVCLTMRAGCLMYLAVLLQGDEIYTALGIAANSRNADIATMLVEAGADADHQDSQVIC